MSVKMNLFISKARPVGDKKPSNLSIHFINEINDYKDLIKQEHFFVEQAMDLEEALFKTLPGGTYDRLLGLMLKRKASQFIVPHMNMG